MGNLLSIVQEEAAAAPECQPSQEMLGALHALEAMGNDRLDRFEHKIQHTTGDRQAVPIGRVLSETRHVRCYSSQSDGLGDGIRKCVDGFATGAVGTALADLVEGAFEGLLGETCGQLCTREQYALSVNHRLGLCRLDLCFLSYKMESASFVKRCDAVLACCVVVSSVDAAQIDESTLRFVVADTFRHSAPKVQKQVYDELLLKTLRKREESESPVDDRLLGERELGVVKVLSGPEPTIADMAKTAVVVGVQELVGAADA